MFKVAPVVAFAALSGTLLFGCGGDTGSPTSSVGSMSALNQSQSPLSPPEFPSDPAAFVAGITNSYLGFAPGRVFRYEADTDEGHETIVVEVLSETKTILGVATTVVHDQVFLGGNLIEDTYDWYAQDQDGNVWYFGEDSREILGGEVVSTEGSWEAGVNSATPGIVMLAEPRIGMKYRQEFAEDVAEDAAQVLSLSKTVTVPFGRFQGALQTMEYSPLSPGAREFKYYAPGVGMVLEVSPSAGRARVELVDVQG
ncbi:MAG: hypothetical protein AB1772_10465 [Candidatus Zixiibacteriota bacterium]